MNFIPQGYPLWLIYGYAPEAAYLSKRDLHRMPRVEPVIGWALDAVDPDPRSFVTARPITPTGSIDPEHPDLIHLIQVDRDDGYLRWLEKWREAITEALAQQTAH